MRLNRYLASAGHGSRRACEELILAGKVSINGHFVTNLATMVEPDDDVRVTGKPTRGAKSVTLLLHKPRGVVSTTSDERGRATVVDLVPGHFGRLFHVGRLDKDSEGLILLTNDGALAQRLTHPSHQAEKEYEVLLNKPYNPEHSAKLLKGFVIEGGRGRFERIHSLTPVAVRIVLRQGIKRQIRLMLYQLGYEVKRLARTRIGGLTIANLPPGAWKLLSQREIDLLESAKPRPTPVKKKTSENTD